MNAYKVIEGAEALYYKGNSIGIILSHGFLGTPQSVKDVACMLAAFGYTVLAPRLTGHGTHYKDIEQATFQEWVKDLTTAYEELKKDCAKVFIVGQSMGGTLALYLAAEDTKIDGIITINAALSVPCYEQFKGSDDSGYMEEGKPDINDSEVVEITYDRVPVRAIKQLLAIIDKTKPKLKAIHCPALLLKSAIDHVVPPQNTDFIFDEIASVQKERITLPHSYHVATMDYDKHYIAEVISQFIYNVIDES